MVGFLQCIINNSPGVTPAWYEGMTGPIADCAGCANEFLRGCSSGWAANANRDVTDEFSDDVWQLMFGTSGPLLPTDVSNRKRSAEGKNIDRDDGGEDDVQAAAKLEAYDWCCSA